jgi:adenine-specific DNA-methyltransferase
MQLTDFHAKYFAHELTKRCPSDSAEKLAGALVDAQDEIDRQRERLIAEIESKLQ